jgi:hypothetical protein
MGLARSASDRARWLSRRGKRRGLPWASTSQYWWDQPPKKSLAIRGPVVGQDPPGSYRPSQLDSLETVEVGSLCLSVSVNRWQSHSSRGKGVGSCSPVGMSKAFNVIETKV